MHVACKHCGGTNLIAGDTTVEFVENKDALGVRSETFSDSSYAQNDIEMEHSTQRVEGVFAEFVFYCDSCDSRTLIMLVGGNHQSEGVEIRVLGK